MARGYLELGGGTERSRPQVTHTHGRQAGSSSSEMVEKRLRVKKLTNEQLYIRVLTWNGYQESGVGGRGERRERKKRTRGERDGGKKQGGGGGRGASQGEIQIETKRDREKEGDKRQKRQEKGIGIYFIRSYIE